MISDAVTALLEVVQVDHSDLIRIDKPRHFSIHGRKLAFQTLAFALSGGVDRRISTTLLISRAQQRRIGQQAADEAPDLLFHPVGLDAAAVARGWAGPRIAGRADVALRGYA